MYVYIYDMQFNQTDNAYLYVDFWSIMNGFKRRISTSAAMIAVRNF
jgi:hypothetical protein